MLPLIRVERDLEAGQWEKSDAGLLAGNEDRNILLAPIEPRGSYQWSLDFIPIEIGQTVALVLPTGTSMVVAEINSQKDQIARLCRLDGKSDRSTEAKKRHDPLIAGQAHRLSARVTKQADNQILLEVALDDERIISWTGKEPQSSTARIYPINRIERPGISTNAGKYQITGMQFKLLDGDARFLDGAALAK